MHLSLHLIWFHYIYLFFVQYLFAQLSFFFASVFDMCCLMVHFIRSSKEAVDILFSTHYLYRYYLISDLH